MGETAAAACILMCILAIFLNVEVCETAPPPNGYCSALLPETGLEVHDQQVRIQLYDWLTDIKHVIVEKFQKGAMFNKGYYYFHPIACKSNFKQVLVYYEIRLVPNTSYGKFVHWQYLLDSPPKSTAVMHLGQKIFVDLLNEYKISCFPPTEADFLKHVSNDDKKNCKSIEGRKFSDDQASFSSDVPGTWLVPEGAAELKVAAENKDETSKDGNAAKDSTVPANGTPPPTEENKKDN